MRTIILIFFYGTLNAQIKITNSGRISLLSHQNPVHDVHAFGYDFGLTHANTTLLFRPKVNTNPGSYIGSTDQIIKFYQDNWNVLIAGYLTYASDDRLKNSISNVENCLSIVRNLQPKKFRYNNFTNQKLHYGFIAQDLYDVIPSVIDTIQSDELGVNYHEIIPILAGAIKEQDKRIDSLVNFNANSRTLNNNHALEKKIDSLIHVVENLNRQIENITKSCCTTSQNIPSGISGQSTTYLHNSDSIFLTNIPNPFKNITSINYSVPSDFKNDLHLIILSYNGKIIRKIKLNSEKGKYELDLSDLQPGVYIYGLLHKNELIKNKTFILEK